MVVIPEHGGLLIIGIHKGIWIVEHRSGYAVWRNPRFRIAIAFRKNLGSMQMHYIPHLWLVRFRSMQSEIHWQRMRGWQSVIVIFDPYRNAAAHFNRWPRPYAIEVPDFGGRQVAVRFLKCLLHADVCDLVRTRPQYRHDGQRINKLLQPI